jgi:DNA-binding response OmpR family regulator
MAHLSPPRVLLIDDEPNIRVIVSDLLVFFGYACETAADGASGLARFDEGGCDLVLTDLAMPGMSGWDVIEAIRQRAPTVPILIITGRMDGAVLERAREWGVTVLAKPFGVATLKAAVVEALSKEPA